MHLSALAFSILVSGAVLYPATEVVLYHICYSTVSNNSNTNVSMYLPHHTKTISVNVT